MIFSKHGQLIKWLITLCAIMLSSFLTVLIGILLGTLLNIQLAPFIYTWLYVTGNLRAWVILSIFVVYYMSIVAVDIFFAYLGKMVWHAYADADADFFN